MKIIYREKCVLRSSEKIIFYLISFSRTSTIFCRLKRRIILTEKYYPKYYLKNYEKILSKVHSKFATINS